MAEYMTIIDNSTNMLRKIATRIANTEKSEKVPNNVDATTEEITAINCNPTSVPFKYRILLVISRNLRGELTATTRSTARKNLSRNVRHAK